MVADGVEHGVGRRRVVASVEKNLGDWRKIAALSLFLVPLGIIIASRLPLGSKHLRTVRAEKTHNSHSLGLAKPN